MNALRSRNLSPDLVSDNVGSEDPYRHGLHEQKPDHEQVADELPEQLQGTSWHRQGPGQELPRFKAFAPLNESKRGEW